jgi:hypothetical protein
LKKIHELVSLGGEKPHCNVIGYEGCTAKATDIGSNVLAMPLYGKASDSRADQHQVACPVPSAAGWRARVWGATPPADAWSVPYSPAHPAMDHGLRPGHPPRYNARERPPMPRPQMALSTRDTWHGCRPNNLHDSPKKRPLTGAPKPAYLEHGLPAKRGERPSSPPSSCRRPAMVRSRTREQQPRPERSADAIPELLNEEVVADSDGLFGRRGVDGSGGRDLRDKLSRGRTTT